MKEMISTGLRSDSKGLWILDQEKLPHEEIWLECATPLDMVSYIRSLKIRGAPLIGVAAALSLGAFAERGANRREFEAAAADLRAARPTAVNLMSAVDRVVAASDPVRCAQAIFDEDVKLCEGMAAVGQEIVNDGDVILTHCNTGGLATAGIGTALGVVVRAHRLGKKVHVFVDETRPLLQGARLTAWELAKHNIPFTLICDNMAPLVMRQKKAAKVLVGSDRIAANGDAANKIGTYGLAVCARHHGLPFYVVAPSTTVDLNCADGSLIPIETRAPGEVRGAAGPRDCEVYNPAFDVTPRELITGYILDTGFFAAPPFQLSRKT